MGGWEQTPPTRADPGTESWDLSWCGQGILSSTRPAHLKAGSHLQPSITSALGPCAHTEPNLGAPQDSPHCRKGWWSCSTPETPTPCSSRVQLGLSGNPALVRVLLSHQTPGEESGPGLRQHSHTYSIPSQGCAFEVFFPSETQPGGKVRKLPHESWSETFRQDISPSECAGSSRCFVETV